MGFKIRSIYYGEGLTILHYIILKAQIRQEKKKRYSRACGALITVSDVYQAQGKN